MASCDWDSRLDDFAPVDPTDRAIFQEAVTAARMEVLLDSSFRGQSVDFVLQALRARGSLATVLELARQPGVRGGAPEASESPVERRRGTLGLRYGGAGRP